MKKYFLFGLILYLFLLTPLFADWSGTVRDASGIPVADVCISDGLNVVKTDTMGKYTLPIRKDARFIFLSAPAGFKAKNKFYQSIQETVSEYNFVLISNPASAGNQIQFIQVSDVEQSGGDIQWIKTIREYVQKNPTAFFVSSGDICYTNGLKFNAQNVNEQTVGLPVYYSIGNHDLIAGKYGEELYESLFGPCWYSFNAGPVHFVVTPMPHGDNRPSYTTKQVTEWLKNDLKQLPAKTPVVIFQHTSPYSKKFDNPASFRYGDIDLKTISLKAWLFGHYHTSIFHTNPETGITFGSIAPPNKGGIDHSVASFYVITMDKTGIKSIDKHNSFWNGKCLETPVLEKSEVDILSPLWSAKAGPEIHFGQPIPVSNGVIVATADDGNRTDCAVVKFDHKGSLCWKTPVGNSIKNTMVTDNKNIYAMDQAWTVYAIDIETGKIVWQDQQGAEATAMMTTPILKDGILYAGLGAGLTAYDAHSGKIQWRNSAWSGGEGSTASLTIIDNILLASANWRALYAHNLKNGKLLWSASNDQLRFRSSTPVPFKDQEGNTVLLVVSHRALQTLNPKDGKIIQSKDTKMNLQTASSPLVLEDMILVGSAEKGLCAFDRNDFHRLWYVKTGSNLVYTSPYTTPVQATIEATPILVGKYIVVGALDGTLYVIDPKITTSDKIVQKIKLGAPILGPASISADGKTLYVSDYAGNVRAFVIKHL